MKNTNLNTNNELNKTILDKMYEKLLRDNISINCEDQELRLETYDLILYE